MSSEQKDNAGFMALTIKSSAGLARVLACQIEILEPTTIQKVSVNAIWDTGATGSVISNNVVQRLGLLPTGKVQVSTANGVVPQNTYIVNISLPNGANFKNITVTEVPGLAGCEALIGMDIITCGDFSITNHNNTTCLSFRLPSSHEIDYCKEPNIKIVHPEIIKN